MRKLLYDVNFIVPEGEKGAGKTVTYGPTDTLPAWTHPILDGHPDYFADLPDTEV